MSMPSIHETAHTCSDRDITVLRDTFFRCSHFLPAVLPKPIACDHGRPRRPVNGLARSFRRA